MVRAEMIARLADVRVPWDVLVIGGGATGLGAAVDAAERGYRTVLLERGDFASATSSRSTKLIHGGVRYLRQGNLGLVRESLRERERLFRNAPHLVRSLPFVLPTYRPGERAFYGAGLWIYDKLAGRKFPLSRRERAVVRGIAILLPSQSRLTDALHRNTNMRSLIARRSVYQTHNTR